MYKLNVHRVIEGTDEWPLVKTIEAETPEKCIELAEDEFGPGGGDEYHWANPY